MRPALHYKQSSAARPSSVALRRPINPALQVIAEEVIHTMPRIVQHMRSCEVMKLAGIHHERKQIAFALLERFVNEPDGFEIGNVDVGRAVQNKQRARQSIDVRNWRGLRIDLRILFRTTDAALSPVANRRYSRLVSTRRDCQR